MTDSVNDLTAKTEKLAIDVKSDKNWCDMPPEIKLECIKTMDFKMRFSLRSTSKTERALVDSQRYHFDEIRVLGGLISELTASNDVKGEQYKIKSHHVPVITYILEKCDIKKFFVWYPREPNLNILYQIEQFIAPESIRTKQFKMQLNAKYDVTTLFFLKKCWKNVEVVDIDFFYEKIPVCDIICIPSVINASVVRIDDFHWNALEASQFAEKWIETDVKLGTIMQVSCYETEGIESLVQKFQERVISQNEVDLNLRINTNNPTKHILMTFKYEEGDDYFLGWTLISVVIPSNLDESEYDKYTSLALI